MSPTYNPFAVSEDDYNAIRYFWNERGDLERWGQFHERQSKLPPALIRAWLDYKHAEAILDAVVQALEPMGESR